MSNRDIIEGKAKQIEGALKDARGDLTGDPADNLEGKAKKAEGQIQEEIGRLGNAARKLGRDVKKAVD